MDLNDHFQLCIGQFEEAGMSQEAMKEYSLSAVFFLQSMGPDRTPGSLTPIDRDNFLGWMRRNLVGRGGVRITDEGCTKHLRRIQRMIDLWVENLTRSN